jgi:superoxide dismutase, Fe-Mn family
MSPNSFRPDPVIAKKFMTPKEYNFSRVTGISQKTLDIHYNKLYKGYVSRANEVGEKLRVYALGGGDIEMVNPTFHDLRALRDGETFAVNAVYLHEHYFDILGGDGEPAGDLKKAIEERWETYENFERYFKASALAARGWLVLSYDCQAEKLKIYMADAHNQGAVWGAEPILVCDCYEHAYFIDYGSDRKTYINDFFKNLNWVVLNEKYKEAKR